MISVEEAQSLLREHVHVGQIVSCKLKDALGLVLARPIRSKLPSPPFDASSVDGYAVSHKSFRDLPTNGVILLPVEGEIQPGDSLSLRLSPGSAIRIFTGGRVPAGADAVVMQEEVRRIGDTVQFATAPEIGANIRPKGGEHPRGRTIFDAETLVTPSVLGSLAALGHDTVKVYARPSIAIVVTGNELRPPGSKLCDSEIWDANSYSLIAALEALGFKGTKLYHARDTPKRVKNALEKALASANVVIVSGGVSVGDHDHVRSALESLEVREIFWRVRVKPGMPIYFGKTTARSKATPKYLFALPGNPVSALVTFQLFVRQALLTMCGVETEAAILSATLTRVIRKSHPRREYVRGIYTIESNGSHVVSSIEARESHMMSGLAHANCLIEFPEDKTILSEGSDVRVYPLIWTYF